MWGRQKDIYIVIIILLLISSLERQSNRNMAKEEANKNTIIISPVVKQEIKKFENINKSPLFWQARDVYGIHVVSKFYVSGGHKEKRNNVTQKDISEPQAK